MREVLVSIFDEIQSEEVSNETKKILTTRKKSEKPKLQGRLAKNGSISVIATIDQVKSKIFNPQRVLL